MSLDFKIIRNAVITHNDKSRKVYCRRKLTEGNCIEENWDNGTRADDCPLEEVNI